jgi:hypothetical protein
LTSRMLNWHLMLLQTIWREKTESVFMSSKMHWGGRTDRMRWRELAVITVLQPELRKKNHKNGRYGPDV